MHQNQFLAAWEDMGGVKNHPIPDSFPMDREFEEVSYSFMTTGCNGTPVPQGRWSEGRSIDGRGSFTVEQMEPRGEKPHLPDAPPNAAAQKTQIKGVASRVVDALTP